MPLSESILARLQYQHYTINELIAALTEEELKHPVNPGKWSAFDNVVHLAAYQPTFIKRINLMLNEQTPMFERYVADNDPLFHQYLKKSLPDLLNDISTDRSNIIKILRQLNEEELHCAGRHPVYGLITINSWADFFLLHEAHHLWTIFQLTSMLRIMPNK